MEPKFNIGDCVKLKHGDQKMTVANFGESEDGGYWYLCEWHDSNGRDKAKDYIEDVLVNCG